MLCLKRQGESNETTWTTRIIINSGSLADCVNGVGGNLLVAFFQDSFF